jgi:hypothetical protein
VLDFFVINDSPWFSYFNFYKQFLSYALKVMGLIYPSAICLAISLVSFLPKNYQSGWFSSEDNFNAYYEVWRSNTYSYQNWVLSV